MCYGDVTPFLERKIPGKATGSVPDLWTMHKCRRFDDLAQWAGTHSSGEMFYSKWEKS